MYVKLQNRYLEHVYQAQLYHNGRMATVRSKSYQLSPPTKKDAKKATKMSAQNNAAESTLLELYTIAKQHLTRAIFLVMRISLCLHCLCEVTDDLF
jgi:hypothetical protein